MLRTDIYIELIFAQPWLLTPIAVIILVLAIAPADKRLFLTLLLVVPWLTIGRSPGLGPISAAAKVSSGGAFLLIAFAAIIHPSMKRAIPGILWIYPLMAFLWIFFVIGVHEQSVAMVLRVQWLLMTLAVLLLLRTINTLEDFLGVINALTIGCIIALSLPISALLLNPVESFMGGLGRFNPYGANANHIGMLFALSTPLIGYAMMTWKRITFRPFLIFLLALILGMALLTASRMTALAIAMVLLPIVLVLTKRPFVTIFSFCILGSGLYWILSLAGDTSMERLGTFESQRTQIWSRYIQNAFAKRPLFGLLGTGGESYLQSNAVGSHPHSAWFNLMYHGGITLLLPMMYMVAYSTYAGYKVWQSRRLLGGNPLLYSVMFMLLVAMYVQGCFIQVVYWPTYSWAFLHVFLAGLFICMWRDIKAGNINQALPSVEEPWQVDEQEELEEFYDYSR